MKITSMNSRTGCIEGSHNDYDFSAKVYEAPSRFGINSGRVSKFDLIKDGEIVAYYDRDWGLSPENEDMYYATQEIVGYFDSMKKVW